jgi:hypothetical protein
MAKVESRLANEFLEQLGNVNSGTARTVGVHSADFEQYVTTEYHEDLSLQFLLTIIREINNLTR